MCVGYFDTDVQYLVIYVRCSRYVCGIFRYGCAIFGYVSAMFTLCVWDISIWVCNIWLCMCDVHVMRKSRYACGILALWVKCMASHC